MDQDAKKTALWKTLPFVLFALGGLGVVITTGLRHPFDPTLEGTARYGHNGEGALTSALVMMFVEILFVTLALRPWSLGKETWIRAILVPLVMAPYAAFLFLLVMHTGSVFLFHALWFFLLEAALALLALGLGGAALWGWMQRRQGAG